MSIGKRCESASGKHTQIFGKYLGSITRRLAFIGDTQTSQCKRSLQDGAEKPSSSSCNWHAKALGIPQKLFQKGAKSEPGGPMEPPGKPVWQKDLPTSRKGDPFGSPFWGHGGDFRVAVLCSFAGALGERVWNDFGAQEASKRDALGGPFGVVF